MKYKSFISNVFEKLVIFSFLDFMEYRLRIIFSYWKIKWFLL